MVRSHDFFCLKYNSNASPTFHRLSEVFGVFDSATKMFLLVGKNRLWPRLEAGR